MPREYGFGSSRVIEYDAHELEQGLARYGQLTKDLSGGRYLILHKVDAPGKRELTYHAELVRPGLAPWDTWAGSAAELLGRVKAELDREAREEG
jgi:hypothetical protein